MKRKKSGGGGANWMDTYGDMVTLLLCFFVLLYSISTIDEQKWLALVRSFNPDAVMELTETSGKDGPVADDVEGAGLEMEQLLAEQAEIEDALDDLYEALVEYSAQSGSGKNIETTKGDGYQRHPGGRVCVCLL